MNITAKSTVKTGTKKPAIKVAKGKRGSLAAVLQSIRTAPKIEFVGQ